MFVREQAQRVLNSEFEVIDEFELDTDCGEKVEKFLRRSGQRAEMQFKNDINGHFAELSFKVGNCPVRAGGTARGKKNAGYVCYMHAMALIEFYTEAEAATQKSKIADIKPKAESSVDQEGNAEGEADGDEEGPAEEPASQQQRPPAGAAKKPPKPLRLAVDNSEIQAPIAPDLPLNPRNPNSWEHYLNRVAEYLERKEKFERRKCYIRMILPTTNNFLVDEAGVRSQMNTINYSARSRLQALCTTEGYRLPPETTVQANKNCHVCSFPLPHMTSVLAVGIGRNRQDASARAAMHALEMIQMLEKVYGSRTRRPATRFERKTEPGVPASGGSVRGAGSERVQRSEEIRSRLIELYTVCLGVGAPTAITEADRDTSMYHAKVSVGDYVCQGTGINKAEAERAAYMSLYEELAANESAFRDIVTLLDAHPHLDPEHLVQLELSESMKEEIAELVGTGEGLDVDPSKMKGHVDLSTQKLIKRIHEHEDVSRSLQMQEQLRNLYNNEEFQLKFGSKKKRLAITAHRKEILELVHNNRVTIICGTTGCGKTTQVPQFLLDSEIVAGKGAACKILITQPRRISAVSIAERIAAERLQKVGEDIGFTIRLQSNPGQHINLCTTGVLLQLFLGNPDLSNVTHLIVDEIHERDLNCDFALVMIKELLEKNDKIKVILMSATLHSELFSSYFGHAPVINVDGQTFPVEEFYLDDIAELAKSKRQSSFMFSSPDELQGKDRKLAQFRTAKDFDYDLLKFLIAHLCKTHSDLKGGGSILVFLPGWKEIRLAKRSLEADDRYHFVLLHSSVDSQEQLQCFQPPPAGKYKIILSTNIAESGVTIDDVRVVIDTGTIKEMSWVLRTGTTNIGRNSSQGINQLITAYASKANCTQRRGRAGRTQGGLCYRFYTRTHFESLPSFQTPEMLRQPLDTIILKILAMGYADPTKLLAKAIQPPPEDIVNASISNLKALGAIDYNYSLTALGQWLTRLPTTPQVGKMIMLGAVMNCLDSILTIAAAAEADPFVSGKDIIKEVRNRKADFAEDSCSDHVAVLNAFNDFSASGGGKDFCYLNYLNFSQLGNISKYKRQFYDILAAADFLDKEKLVDTQLRRTVRDSYDHPIPFLEVSTYSSDSRDIGLVKSVVTAGLYPNVALRNTFRIGNKKQEKILRTKLQNHLVIGKNSVAYRAKEGEATSCPFYVYRDIVHLADANTEFLDAVTSANIWAILLLGASNSHVQYRDDLNLGVIDEWIMFRSSPETVETILRLKKLFQHCLWRKFSAPNDKENNEKLGQIQRLTKALVNMPIKPNDLTGVEWIQSGKIQNPEPLDSQRFGSNVEHVQRAISRSTEADAWKDDDDDSPPTPKSTATVGAGPRGFGSPTQPKKPLDFDLVDIDLDD
jgi:HrpA-like RNA helicase